MSELSERLVAVAADTVAYENPFDITTGDGKPTLSEVHLAEVVIIAVLEEFSGFLDWQATTFPNHTIGLGLGHAARHARAVAEEVLRG